MSRPARLEPSAGRCDPTADPGPLRADRMSDRPVCVLTIAGSDSGGGAGIQADIRAITALGAFATCAVTALTAQNTCGVRGALAVDAEFVGAQIDAVMEDIGADAAKTGMLGSPEVVRVVADRVRRYGIPNLVVDPVMAAQSGDQLVSDETARAMVQVLLPEAVVVTPNLSEAAWLAEMRIESLADMREAARRVRGCGSRFVIVKGGHLEGDEAVDVLFDGKTFREFAGPRLPAGAHGSGCTFAAALAAHLGMGLDMVGATAVAKAFTARAIRDALRPGKGSAVINPRGRAPSA